MNDIYENILAFLGLKKKLLTIPEIQENLRLSGELLAWYRLPQQEYIKHSEAWRKYNKYVELVPKINKYYYRKLDMALVSETNELLKRFDQKIREKNDRFIADQLVLTRDFFDDVDGKSLDEQQRTAVLTDEENNLVIAGAGSGKTLVVAAKAKYLVEWLNVAPEKILLLSFTKESAREMQNRITDRLGIKAHASTFHKLGLSIIGMAAGKKPDVYDPNKRARKIHEFFKESCKADPALIQKLIVFFGMYYSIPIDYDDFESLGDAYDQMKHVDLETIKSRVARAAADRKKNKTTIKGEQVKSFEEVLIANFLYLNGIKYTYEKPYKYETADATHRQYKPDFYLDEYDIYLEHFGVNREYKTPMYSSMEETKYLTDISWKRELHERHDTKLIETYSYYCSEGILYKKLEELLRENKVALRQIDYTAIYKTLFEENDNAQYKELVKLLITFIDLFKSNGYDWEDFKSLQAQAKREKNQFLRQRSKLFFDLAEKVLIYYQDLLDKSGEIDFNDMINKATSYIENRNVSLGYQYIIIDEYQDISASRYKLAKAIRDQNAATLVAVGDDWQSIYRFAGSDVGLFTNFKKALGPTRVLKIEQTYRNSQDLIDIASGFILENPMQIPKRLRSNVSLDNPVIIHLYESDLAGACEKAIDQIVRKHGHQSEILLLGRNNFDIGEVEKSPRFKLEKSSEGYKVIYNKYPSARIYFLTVHRSKGLEADNVIILNMKNSLLGFPNKMADDPVLKALLTAQDEILYGEERRLFYVALTRTKNTVHLLVPQGNPSAFARELTKMITTPIDTDFEIIASTGTSCPVCGTGKLMEKLNNQDHKPFVGCSNYPLCGFTCDIAAKTDGFQRCPLCGGFIYKRKGKYGDFFGCTNYPACRYTESIEETEY